VTHPPKLSIFM
jgi:hypothetical protein